MLSCLQLLLLLLLLPLVGLLLLLPGLSALGNAEVFAEGTEL